MEIAVSALSRLITRGVIDNETMKEGEGATKRWCKENPRVEMEGISRREG